MRRFLKKQDSFINKNVASLFAHFVNQIFDSQKITFKLILL